IMFFAPAWSRRRKAAHARSLGDPVHTSVKSKPRLGRGLQPKRGSVLGTRQAASRKQEAGSRKQEAGSRKQEAGSRKQEAGSRKLPPRADSPLAEQARNRDHDSSDPSSQAKKQQKIAQKHRHIAPPLCLR